MNCAHETNTLRGFELCLRSYLSTFLVNLDLTTFSFIKK
jgi:hypothetical protein